MIDRERLAAVKPRLTLDPDEAERLMVTAVRDMWETPRSTPYTIAYIAYALGVSRDTVRRIVYGAPPKRR